jgi:hypothetical protein
MQLGKSQTNTQWMFVRESSETLEEEEECGVEVACTLNAPKVSENRPSQAMKQHSSS